MNMRYLNKDEIILPLNRGPRGASDTEYRQYVEIIGALKLWKENYGFFKNAKSIRLATEKEDKDKKIDIVVTTEDNKEIKVQLKLDRGQNYIHMRDREYDQIKRGHYGSDNQIQYSYREGDYRSLGYKKIENLIFLQITCINIEKIKGIIQHSNLSEDLSKDYMCINGNHYFKKYFYEDGYYIRIPQDLIEGLCVHWL